MVVNCQSNYLMYYFMGFRFHGFSVSVSRSGLDGGGGGGGAGGDVESILNVVSIITVTVYTSSVRGRVGCGGKANRER